MPSTGLELILNYLAISDAIGTAGQPRPHQFSTIRAAGYEVVVNLAMPDSTAALPNEAELVRAQGMEYVHIPVVWEKPTPSDLEKFFEVMDGHEGKRLFVHCALNMRVSVFMLLYRVIRQGVSLETAQQDLALIWEPDETWERFLHNALNRYQAVPGEHIVSDPRQIVTRGYDLILEEYSEWAPRVRMEERARYTAVLLGRLPPGAEVLELGCAAGLPTTWQLAGRFSVTGVDISARQIAAARANVPAARFIHADMTALDFPPSSFDAVAAFYSLIHVPRQDQPALLRNVASWLRPGGLLVATMGAQAVEAGLDEDWLGAPMYWSSYDAETNRHLVQESGFSILSAREETAEEFGQPVTFLWVIAEKLA
jgi:SAM-dependent methyltransferase/protein tyrosine phosphatase (PTP) superfamily phosphohydrolase (DUF442 family)